MRLFEKLKFFSIAVVFLVALWPQAASGQTVYGSITGTVLDPTGAAVPGAAVTLTNLGTSDKRSMESGASGSYTFVDLVPGRYRIEGEKSGFKRLTREPIVVEVGSGLRIDLPMEVGAVSQTIEVKAATPLLQPQSSDLGQVVEARSVTEMPLNGRNVLALVALAPGVVPQGPPSGGNSSTGNPVGSNPFAAGDFQVGGGQAGQSAVILDGVPTNGSYLNVITLIPTQDAIQEFKIQTNNMGPEFGRFAGGIINMTTKSGGNSFHGSAYEFLRNKVLDANDFFLNKAGVPVGPYTQNQFGANLGGRVIRDKVFFFSSYEGYRVRKAAAFTSTVPTAAMTQNYNFSEWATAAGVSNIIFDPLTGSDASCAGGANCRTAFTGNVIPAARIDSAAKVLLGYFPAPTSTALVNNFTTSYSTGGDTDQYNEKIDYNLSDKQRLTGRFTYYKLLNLPDSPFKDICTDRCTETVHTKQVALGDTITFSPTTILDLHLGYTRYAYVRTPLTAGFNMSTLGPAWGTYQFTSTPLPYACVSNNQGDNFWGGGFCSAGTGSGIGAHDDTWSFTPSLTKIRGAHTLKMGWEFRLLRNNYYQSNQPSGGYAFDRGMTSEDPLGSGLTTGNGFASFLLGYGSRANNGGDVVTPSLMASQLFYDAMYFGDTFQATKKLTLNLGVRYELQGNWTERHNRLIDFLPGATSPLSSAVSGVTNPATGQPFGTLKGAFTLVDSAARPNRTAVNMPWTDFNPRIGLAYRLNDKTVIRTGYGIFFLPVDVRWNDAPHNMFNNTYSTAWLATLDNGVTPNTPFSAPFPNGVIQPPGRNQTWINAQGSGLSGPVPNNPYSYAQQWNFNIQRELPDGTLIDVAYAGAKGTHLPMHSQDVDQLPYADMPAANGGPGTNGYTAATLSALVTNPFYGLLQSGNLTAATVQTAHLLLPYPQYDDVSLAEPNDRDSTYHSMQLKVQKRFSRGGSILASYTIAKLISNTNNEINWLGDAAPGWGDTDGYNIRNEKSLDGFDVPQRFVLAYVLDLPVGKGRKYGNSLTPVANKIVSGWGIDGILTLSRLFPLSMGGGSNALGAVPNGGGARLTRTGNEKLMTGSTGSRLNEWFDTSVFSSTTSFTRGNDSRTEPVLRSDGMKNFDFALFKNTRFGPEEKLGLEFRAEFFNLFNHPQFSAPNTSCCTPYPSGNFGVVSSQYNLPRVIQFGLKLNF